MWREEAGFLEMLFSYIGDYQAFSGLNSWRRILEEILTCHEDFHLRKIENIEDRIVGNQNTEPQTDSNTYLHLKESDFLTSSDDVATTSTSPQDWSFIEVKVEDATEGAENEETESMDQMLQSGSHQFPPTQVAPITLHSTESAALSTGIAPVNFTNDGRETFLSPCHQPWLNAQRKFEHSSRLSSTRRRPYNCPLCGKAFHDKRTMTIHIRSHTGERPYACAFCNKSFKASHHLRAHERTHTGERPYLCRVCGKSFTQSGSRATHMKLHGPQFG